MSEQQTQTQTQTKAVRELTHEVEFVELPPLVVKEQLLRLFNNQIQRDYTVADFVAMDGNIVVKLKRRGAAGK
jgi:hypothetical protein